MASSDAGRWNHDRTAAGSDPGLWDRFAREQAGGAIDALSSHVALLDSTGVVVAVNRAWQRFGAQNGLLVDSAGIGRSYLAVCDAASGPESSEAARCADGIRRLLAGQIEEFRQQYRCETAIGPRWYQMRATRFVHGARTFAVVVHEDITEVMRAYSALAESEARFFQITEVIDQVFWMKTLSPVRVAYVSPSVERLFGIRPEEIYRNPGRWMEIVHPEDAPRVRESIGAWIERGGPGCWTEEYRVVRPDGSVRWVRDSAHGLPAAADRGGKILCGVAEDVTELREHRDRLEHLVQERTAQLRESQELLAQQDRLASIGTLAAGLGHDLANILFPMRCRLDVLEASALPAALRPEVDGLKTTVEYLRQLSAALRQCAIDPISAGQPRGPTRLSEWANGVRPLIEKSAAGPIDLAWEIGDDLPAVAVAPHQLTQAVLNLVGNATESIDGPGRIVVRAEPPRTLAGPVELSVIDTGCGMSDEARRHALEPFFTTKQRGRSTGLGLSLVHAIVRSVDGEIRIDSAEGRGTTVTLRLPRWNPRAGEPDRPPAAHPHRAAIVGVSLASPRRSAMVRHVAAAMGLRAVDSDPDGAEPPDIWVVDESAASPDAARDFLAAGPERGVVVFGPARMDWTALGVEHVGEEEGLDALRRALRQARRGRMNSP